MATRPPPPVPNGHASHSRDRTRSRSRQEPGRSHRQRIGAYIIERTLGTGSFGKVKLATHCVTGHQVALKFISRAKIQSPDMNARVKREIQYLKVLRHPHIIKLYEVITTPTDVIMVMEYAGEELFNYIVANGKGGMSESEARRFFQQIIGAIEYCHLHSIVHRDLKPENLLMDQRKNIKIGDFGLSNLMTDGDFLKTSCGSPNYAAPEVISGKLYSGPEIDVWSAGVIMYVLLVGKLPFDDEHIPTLFKKIESGNFHTPSHLSDGAKHLLKRMLCTDPLKRATIAEIRKMPFFQEDLPRYLQPLPEMERYPTLPMDDLSTLLMINEGRADPKKLAEEKGLVWTEDLGIIDPDIIEALQEKISAFPAQAIWEELRAPGDNTVKVAYQLVRDHKRILKDSMYAIEDEDQTVMEEFLASSPPAWNMDMPPSRSESNMDEVDVEEVDLDIQDIPNAHFDVLDSSLPKPASPGATTPTIPQPTPKARAEKPLQRPRWHFGIRSRSPPMEVMLEIYKTLSVLGMQWKRKDGIELPEIGTAPPEGYPEEVDQAIEGWAAQGGKVEMGQKVPGRKEAQHLENNAKSLYLVETRSRYGEFIVRMDLQLYQVDEENYLVDFRNIGYYLATDVDPEAKGPKASLPPSRLPSDDQLAAQADGAATGGEDMSRKAARQGGKEAANGSIGGVSGPFHFLEMACQLIAELAS